MVKFSTDELKQQIRDVVHLTADQTDDVDLMLKRAISKAKQSTRLQSLEGKIPSNKKKTARKDKSHNQAHKFVSLVEQPSCSSCSSWASH